MSETREEFEKLPEIAVHLKHGNVFFDEEKQTYASDFSALHFVACYVNGAWYAFQEQQKTLDAYKVILKTRIGFDIVNSILDQSISDDCQNGIISKGEFLVGGKNSDSGQSKEVSISISKDGKITKIGD